MNVKWQHALALVGFALALGSPNQSFAVPIHVSASGIIDDVVGLDYASVGDRWSLELTYESDTPDFYAADPDRAFYIGYQNFSITVGAHTFGLNQLMPGVSGTFIRNRGSDVIGYSNEIIFAGALDSPNLDFNLSAIQRFLYAPDRLLTSDAYPNDPLLLESMFRDGPLTDQLVFTIFDSRRDGSPDEDRWINASMESFSASSVSVPEPSALVLFAPAFIMLGFAGRKGRRMHTPA